MRLWAKCGKNIVQIENFRSTIVSWRSIRAGDGSKWSNAFGKIKLTSTRIWWRRTCSTSTASTVATISSISTASTVGNTCNISTTSNDASTYYWRTRSGTLLGKHQFVRAWDVKVDSTRNCDKRKSDLESFHLRIKLYLIKLFTIYINNFPYQEWIKCYQECFKITIRKHNLSGTTN